MSEAFINGRVTLHSGDSRDVLKTLADCSIDSIVTDPPYALVSIQKRFGKPGSAPVKVGDVNARNDLKAAYARASAGFMGKQWDTGETAFASEFWAECLRVLKPGGHVVAFSGTRTYHRMACAIEDAGFDVRNMLSWNFGSGFPKSHNISKTLDDKKERCSCLPDLRGLRDGLDSSQSLSGGSQQDMRTNLHGSDDRREKRRAEGDSVNPLRDVREADPPRAVQNQEDAEILLQPFLPEQDVCDQVAAVCCERVGEAMPGQGVEGREKRRMEGGCDLSESAGQLRQRSLRALPAGSDVDGTNGRLRDGASVGDGAVGRSRANAGRVRSPSGSQAAKQSADELGNVARQSEPQTGGAWEDCGRCGKPLVPDGLGTDLKPAHEPICLARKPLTGTVAANVLQHGTGAINIDGCRVGSDGGTSKSASKSVTTSVGSYLNAKAGDLIDAGRWPANVIHDGSEEVVAAFPDAGSNSGAPQAASGLVHRGDAFFGNGKTVDVRQWDDSRGSAARFFYTAKADADDRLGSKHPTVKPIDLMQWLCRLVTPKGGTILDPFAGTGTTGEAAFREGFNAVLIERETEYQADIRRRMALCLAGPDERKRESIKAKTAGQPIDAGPLFGGLDTPPAGEANLRSIRGRTIGQPTGLKW